MMKAILPLAMATAMIGYAMPAHASDDTQKIETRQNGFEHGYTNGYHSGMEAKKANAAPDFHTKDFKRGDVGYEAYMGSHDVYKKGYREGYETGYKDGFAGTVNHLSETYAPAASADNARNTASQNSMPQSDAADSVDRAANLAFEMGYNDGVHSGAKDRDSAAPYAPESSEDFKDADHGFRESMGSKDDYKRAYRRGFTNGYRDAFGPQK